MPEPEKEIVPVQLPTDYDADESFLIATQTGTYLGGEGDHRILTLNMDNNSVHIYEAVSGTDRYPPGRMMNVKMSRAEFEAIIKTYQGRAARMEEKERKEREAYAAPARGEDFDPFLAMDDIP